MDTNRANTSEIENITNYRTLVEVILDRKNSNQTITFINSSNDEVTVSYGEVLNRALHILSHLQDKGMKSGDQLLFQLNNNRDFIYAFWACLLGKIIPVPVAVGFNEALRSKLINIWKILKKPCLMISADFKNRLQLLEQTGEMKEIFHEIKNSTILIEEAERTRGNGEISIPNESETVYIQFSSGSTGDPKGIVLTHKNLITNIKAILKGLESPELKDITLSWMPLIHDMGLIGFHMVPLVANWNQFLMPTELFIRRPGLWLSKISEHKITLTSSPNFGYRYVLSHFKPEKHKNLDLSSLRLIFNGAEPISAELCDEFLDKMAPYGLKRNAMFPVYGLAEASLAVSFSKPGYKIHTVKLDRNFLNIGDKVRKINHEPLASTFVEVGYPVDFCSVKITNEKGNVVEDECIGHIQIKGNNVTSGYYNNSNATRKAITSDGWLNTGDLGFMRKGCLVITGRKKDIIFVNGQNYYSHDIEQVANTVEGIETGKIAIAGSFNKELQQDEVICFVIFKRHINEFVPLTTRLRQHIRKTIGIELDKVIPIKRIPKTTSGKAKRYKLRESYENGDFDEVLREISKLEKEIKPVRTNLPKNEVERFIVDVCKDVLGLKLVDVYDNFFEMGGKSIHIIQINERLQKAFNRDIPDIAMFRYPTIDALAKYLSTGEPGVPETDKKNFLDRVDRWSTGGSLDRQALAPMNIAIIGMAGKFPGAKTIEEYWKNLKSGVESISFFTEEELKATGISPDFLEDSNYVKAKGILQDIEYFDASFFGYKPAEAKSMDPQMRVYHECVWNALEDAGYNPISYQGLIGLYIGASPNHSWEAPFLSGNRSASEQFVELQLNDKDFMSTRISYKLNLKGPSFTLYTACSTSLVAVDLACRGLAAGGCHMALAGGISIWMPQKSGYLYEEGMLFSTDGHNRTFAADASGTVFSDGAGVVVLKPLKDAVDDRDNIYAVIRGSAINNDGYRKVGYTAPSLEGQAEVISAALRAAQVAPETIGYIEAHGTATTLGDPIEIEALKLAFNCEQRGFCAIGSVKANLGHLNAAAGIAGLIKAVLMLKHRLIPPSLHCNEPNPRIDFANSPFYVNTELKEWTYTHHPRRIGVSSFGIGGTNVHLILEEALPVQKTPGTRAQKLILLSAATSTSLQQLTDNFIDYLEENPEVDFSDIAYTLQVGRRTFKHRKMVVCSNREQAIQRLSVAESESVATMSSQKGEPHVVFMFPGVGAQYVNMCLELYRNEAEFRQEMDRCFEILLSLTDEDIKGILFPVDHPEEVQEKMNLTYITQTVMFIVEYSLAKFIMKLGIHPHALIGYSFGEYTAACLSGVFSLKEALQLIISRGRLLKEIPKGTMLSVPAPADEISPMLNSESLISLAIDNGPSCVIAGPPEAVKEFENRLKTRRLVCMPLATSHAIHSTMMKPLLERFEAEVDKITLDKPRIPYISNVSGQWIKDEEATDPAYWARHLRNTVRFADGIRELVKDSNTLFIEIGPGRDLSLLIRRFMQDKPHLPIIDLVKVRQKDVSDVYFLMNRIGRLWLHGVPIDWNEFYGDEKRQRVPLPTYSFERQRYWIEGHPFKQSLKSLTEELSSFPSQSDKKTDIADWLYFPLWKQSVPAAAPEKEEEPGGSLRWLVFANESVLASQLDAWLKEEVQEVIQVKIGTAFEKENDSLYRLHPGQPDHYERLSHALSAAKKMPHRIAHLWGISGRKTVKPGPEAFNKAQELGFFSLLYTARALFKQDFAWRIRLDVVTDNMQPVNGQEIIYPEKATVLAAVKVIAQEYPGITCRSIDVELLEPGRLQETQEKQLIDRLTRELLSQFSDGIIAYRNNRRWVEVFEPCRLNKPDVETAGLRKEGVYLITGGMGEIGAILAEHLARTVKAKLVLMGRSFFPDEKEWQSWLDTHGEKDKTSSRIKQVQRLRDLGAEVLVYRGDVSILSQVQEAISVTLERFGRIDGVIHAAGNVTRDAFRAISEIDGALCDQHFTSKVYGLYNLETVLEDKNVEPDFVMVMSSISAILGGVGFAAYAAANIFMDAFIQRHNRTHKVHWTSVNWETWLLGKALQTQTTGTPGATLVQFAMTPPEGIEAFQRILPLLGEERIVLSSGVLNARIDTWLQLKLEPTLSVHSRENLSTPYVAPRNPGEHSIASIWGKFFGIERIGIDDDFFELGGDSLKAIAVASLINKEFGVKIPISEFFNRLSIRGIGEYLNNSRKTLALSLEPTEAKEYYAVSIAQKKLFILNEIEGMDTAYNIFRVFSIQGKPDNECFEKTISLLIKQHESLRSSFELRNSEPVQVIHESVDFKPEYIDGEKLGKQELQALIAQFSKPFDLKKAPLIRVGFVRLSAQRHLLLFDMHHIISDGVSMGILIRDFVAMYEGKDLPGLRIQYKDFSQWQHRFFEEEEFKWQENYWLEKFNDNIPVLNLPTDYSRPEVQSFEGDKVSFWLDEMLTEALNRLAKQTETTLYMVLLAVYNILLSRFTGQEDIILSSPFAARNRPGMEHIIGLFINMLVMRNNPSGNKSFSNFLNEVKMNTLEAYENQEYPFSKLMEKLGVEKDISRNKLIDAELIMLNMEIPPLEIEGLTFTPYEYNQKVSQVDIALEVQELEGKIRFDLVYCVKLFKKETIKRLSRHFVNIIKCVLENPKVRISEIEILTKEERQKILKRLKKHDNYLHGKDLPVTVTPGAHRKMEADFDFSN